MTYECVHGTRSKAVMAAAGMRSVDDVQRVDDVSTCARDLKSGAQHVAAAGAGREGSRT